MRDARGGNRGATAKDEPPVGQRKFSFTKKELEHLQPGNETYYVWDTDRGLCLAVNPSGLKTFFFRRKIDGRSERIRLGIFPDLTIEKARGKAGGLREDIADGRNPAEERRSLSAEMTLGELWQLYLKRHAEPYKRESSIKADKWLWKAYLKRWQNRKLSGIRRGDVQTHHGRIGRSNGHYAANHMLALLRHMFTMAGRWGWQGGNPCQGVTRFKVVGRERFLQADELPRFFAALSEEPNRTLRDFVVLALLTGARRSNVAGMRWEDVDLEGRSWTIPETAFKGGRPHVVALVPAAISILQERRAECEQLAMRVQDRTTTLAQPSAQREAKRWARESILASNGTIWVLPGIGKTGHFVEYKHGWASLLKRAGIEKLRLHDLRRTLGSWQAALGANLAVIQKSLGHADVSSTMIYSRLNLDPVRQAMEQATAAILTAGGFAPAGEVVPISKGKVS